MAATILLRSVSEEQIDLVVILFESDIGSADVVGGDGKESFAMELFACDDSILGRFRGESDDASSGIRLSEGGDHVRVLGEA